MARLHRDIDRLPRGDIFSARHGHRSVRQRDRHVDMPDFSCRLQLRELRAARKLSVAFTVPRSHEGVVYYQQGDENSVLAEIRHEPFQGAIRRITMKRPEVR